MNVIGEPVKNSLVQWGGPEPDERILRGNGTREGIGTDYNNF